MSHDHTRLPLVRDDAAPASSAGATFEEVLARRLSRRRALVGLGLTATAVLTGCGDDDVVGRSEEQAAPPPGGTSGTPGPAGQGGAGPGTKPASPPVLGFPAVPKSVADAVVLPAGYSATVLYRLGDPLGAAVGAYANDGTDPASTFAQRAGDHHDGMHYFGLGANGRHDATRSDRGLLVMNHEAITSAFLHPTGQTISGTGPAAVRTVAEEVVKEMNAHGVSVVEVARGKGGWTYEKASPRNRRVTTVTPMTLSGPAARSPYLVTKYSPDGSKTRGTVNNCASGYTPWGTYLTCEENWAGYFRRIAATDDGARTPKELAALARYGVAGNGRELWATVSPDTPDDLFGRWNAERKGASADGSDDYRNAPNTFGWVVEIDPFDPTSTPKKRTALGRFAHEGCWLGPVVAGQPLVWYMGCDGRNEYIYKFVSAKPWDPADSTRGLAAGDAYLDEGKLYVARFDADGSGAWIELTYGAGNVTGANAAYAFADQADVLVHARLAADAAGATKMDRPEWGAVHPATGEVYFTLTNTNDKSRPLDRVDAANPRFYDDPKNGAPQRGNPNGHVIRMAEEAGRASATRFVWDIYLFGARATADATSVNLSGLTADNDFSSPDGCWFSRATPGLLWLQTDDGAYTDVTNCMMLAAVPGKVGDGGKKTVTSTDGVTTRSVETRVGKAPGSAQLRRFLVGPRECEITGIAETPDGRALFVNVQHPGEDTKPDLADPQTFGSHWPDGGSARPRSATIVITRDDGGVVGVAG